MNHKTIKNLQELRLKRAELKMTVKSQEINLASSFGVLKNQLFSFENSELDLLNIGDLRKEIVPLISNSLVSLMVTKWLKPKSKLVKKAAIYFGTSLIQNLILKGSKQLVKRLNT